MDKNRCFAIKDKSTQELKTIELKGLAEVMAEYSGGTIYAVSRDLARGSSAHVRSVFGADDARKAYFRLKHRRNKVQDAQFNQSVQASSKAKHSLGWTDIDRSENQITKYRILENIQIPSMVVPRHLLSWNRRWRMDSGQPPLTR